MSAGSSVARVTIGKKIGGRSAAAAARPSPWSASCGQTPRGRSNLSDPFLYGRLHMDATEKQHSAMIAIVTDAQLVTKRLDCETPPHPVTVPTPRPTRPPLLQKAAAVPNVGRPGG